MTGSDEHDDRDGLDHVNRVAGHQRRAVYVRRSVGPVVGLRRRHRADPGRTRRRLRQGGLRHQPGGRGQHRRDRQARRDLPGRSGHRQSQHLLRPEHGAGRDQPRQPRRRMAWATRPAWSTGTTSAFDPEGIFDGKPSMFVSSVDRNDPSKNVIFRIGPDGAFLGAYIKFDLGSGAGAFSYVAQRDPGAARPAAGFPAGLISGDGSPMGTGTSDRLRGAVLRRQRVPAGHQRETADPAVGGRRRPRPVLRPAGRPDVRRTAITRRRSTPCSRNFGVPPGPIEPGSAGPQRRPGLIGDLLI